MTMNEMKNAVFSANWQPGVPKYNWVNWQWAAFTNQIKIKSNHFYCHITTAHVPW